MVIDQAQLSNAVQQTLGAAFALKDPALANPKGMEVSQR